MDAVDQVAALTLTVQEQNKTIERLNRHISMLSEEIGKREPMKVKEGFTLPKIPKGSTLIAKLTNGNWRLGFENDDITSTYKGDKGWPFEDDRIATEKDFEAMGCKIVK